MDTSGEIFAFLMNGKIVCFNCFDPNKDKEDEILAKNFITEGDPCICDRCKRIMEPDRRMINRRCGEDRRCQFVEISFRDRRSGKERRRGEERRNPT
jgi:hypothetical protein